MPIETIELRITHPVRDTGVPHSTLSHPLPRRIKGPLIVELSLDGKSSRRTIYPRDPSYNLVPVFGPGEPLVALVPESLDPVDRG